MGIPSSGVPTQRTLQSFQTLHARVEQGLNEEERKRLEKIQEDIENESKWFLISLRLGTADQTRKRINDLEEQRRQIYQEAAQRTLNRQEREEYQEAAEIISQNPHLTSLAQETAMLAAHLQTLRNTEQIMFPNLQQSFQQIPLAQPPEGKSMVDTTLALLEDPNVQDFLGGDENVEQLRQRLEYLRWLIDLKKKQTTCSLKTEIC